MLGKLHKSTVFKPRNEQEECFLKAIDTIKKSDLKGKYVKVELEADIHRQREVNECHEWILENVSKAARGALTYSRLYRDGSVDTEFTFTLPLDKAYLVPEFITVFRDMSRVCGTKFDTTGAGMHIAILNSKDGNYPRGNTLNTTKYNNFSKSMQSLLPALYFLGSCCATTRPLSFREPRISSTKYSAISRRGREHCVLEYRVFDTCYQEPTAFLDYICVIANTLQFYKAKQVKLPFFGTIGMLLFQDYGYHLSRLYNTESHIKALDAGLAILKPSYKTIEQLKKERGFKVDINALKREEEKLIRKWKQDFNSDKKRVPIMEKMEKERAGLYWEKLNSNEYRNSPYYYQDEAHNMTKSAYLIKHMRRWRSQNLRHLRDEEKYIEKKKLDMVNMNSNHTYPVTV